MENEQVELSRDTITMANLPGGVTIELVAMRGHAGPFKHTPSPVVRMIIRKAGDGENDPPAAVVEVDLFWYFDGQDFLRALQSAFDQSRDSCADYMVGRIEARQAETDILAQERQRAEAAHADAVTAANRKPCTPGCPECRNNPKP